MVEDVFKDIILEEKPSLENKDAWKGASLNFEQAWKCTDKLAIATKMLTKTEK